MCDNPIVAIWDGIQQPRLYGPFTEYYGVYEHTPEMFRLLLPCGRCLPCRMAHARSWILRCKDELSLHDNSCFVTLTYNDEHLPENEELCKDDYQRFFKRLRKSISPCQIRYFGCGEYGRENLRPHFHFIVFGWCPPDCVPWTNTGRSVVCRSALLDSLWSDSAGSIGYATVGTVTDDSIAYVCRYNLKKLDLDTSGKAVQPFTVSSSRPAIGLRWLKKYSGDLLVKDENGVIVRYGHPDSSRNLGFVGTPRYYTKKLCEGSSDVRHALNLFNLRFGDLCKDDVERRLAFTEARLVHNTHYGRNTDVLARFQVQQTIEETNR